GSDRVPAQGPRGHRGDGERTRRRLRGAEGADREGGGPSVWGGGGGRPRGLRGGAKSPWVRARLPDGSRVHAIVPPLSLCGPVLNVRKFSSVPLRPNDLLEHGTIGPRMLGFLAACVRGRMNIVISGGTSSGKTTLLGVLSSFVPPEERLITIEDAAELRLAQPHVIGLESR